MLKDYTVSHFSLLLEWLVLLPGGLPPPRPPPGLVWVDQRVCIPCNQTRDLGTNQRQQLVANFRHQVANSIPLPDSYILEVAITDFGMTFKLPAAVQDRFAYRLRHSSFTVGDDINPDLFQIRDPTDYTDMVITMKFIGVNFENLTSQHSFPVNQLLPALRETLRTVGISEPCVVSSRILLMRKEHIKISMSKEPDSATDLTTEVEKLATAGVLQLNLHSVFTGDVTRYDGTFDSICPPLSPGDMCPCPTGGSVSLVYEDQSGSAGLSTPDKLGLAVGVPVALAALAGLGALLMFCLKKKKRPYRPPTAKPRRSIVSPIVDSFETNIYSASMDDAWSHRVGKRGPQLNRFRDPDAVYGRLSYSPPPSTASSTSTRESWLPGPDVY
ncbi:uncharacterized protein [Branchiostoma lanceolatum]|uniref:uncharacterized protein n=1 Tax=Branchiostoma lanceolatum TaxID=7740 RepID=UPI00345274CD